jgi:hypothetical protein
MLPKKYDQSLCIFNSSLNYKVMTDKTKHTVKALADQIALDIKNIDGTIINLKNIETTLTNDDIDGAVAILWGLTAQKTQLLNDPKKL